MTATHDGMQAGGRETPGSTPDALRPSEYLWEFGQHHPKVTMRLQPRTTPIGRRPRGAVARSRSWSSPRRELVSVGQGPVASSQISSRVGANAIGLFEVDVVARSLDPLEAAALAVLRERLGRLESGSRIRSQNDVSPPQSSSNITAYGMPDGSAILQHAGVAGHVDLLRIAAFIPVDLVGLELLGRPHVSGELDPVVVRRHRVDRHEPDDIVQGAPRRTSSPGHRRRRTRPGSTAAGSPPRSERRASPRRRRRPAAATSRGDHCHRRPRGNSRRRPSGP